MDFRQEKLTGLRVTHPDGTVETVDVAAEVADLRELRTMCDREAVAYWNVLTMGATCFTVGDGKDARHLGLVSLILRERGIPHEHGKLIESAPVR